MNNYTLTAHGNDALFADSSGQTLSILLQAIHIGLVLVRKA
jgi:hypothetical protein